MDQTRLFTAIALSFLVFFLWEFFFVEKEDLNQQPIKEKTLSAEKEKSVLQNIKPDLSDNLNIKNEDVTEELSSYKSITVDTPLYSVQIREKGAVFKSFVLKNYRENVDPTSPLLELVSTGNNGGTLRVGLAGSSIPGLENALFSTKQSSDLIQIKDSPKEVSFFWASDNGITVEKKFIFSPDTYVINLGVNIINKSDTTIQDNLILSLSAKAPEESKRFGFEGPGALIDNKLEQIKIKKIKNFEPQTGKIRWIALQDCYFMSSIIPKTTVQAGMHLFIDPGGILEAVYVQPQSTIDSGNTHLFEYSLYFGPKSMDALDKADYDLDKAINFGMFDFIAKPCVLAMNFLYKIIPNYGVAIIILTVFIKLILWPLGSKSYKSMSEMKKLQPLITEIREKYKGNKQKMNQEIMGLYKTYKVNPLGGCLPMIVQIPIFFALYRMLYEAIELRHAPFLGWINDLSAPDRLFRFDFSIPFMQPPYGIPVLTIIMGGTMYLQQKMSPPMGDPAQAKMMMFMPIIFTVIFINFSSGLVLYWLVNNIISISQQYYIQKKHA